VDTASKDIRFFIAFSFWRCFHLYCERRRSKDMVNGCAIKVLSAAGPPQADKLISYACKHLNGPEYPVSADIEGGLEL
jgi:hypothetical protein